MRIEDSVVAVTGGASGLGEAVARRCIDQGAAGVAILVGGAGHFVAPRAFEERVTRAGTAGLAAKTAV